MGLLTILKKVKEKEKEMRILILGLDNAGKTTIVKKFCGQSIDDIAPTLGFQIQTLEHSGYKLNLWDIGGQKSIRAYWRNYFESTDGIIWVVDSVDTTRLQLCKQELVALLHQERLVGASLLIFANKQDLVISSNNNNKESTTTTTTTGMTLEQITNVLELNTNDNFNKNRHWAIHACSAKTGQGLIEGIDWLVQDIANRIFLLA